MIEILLLVSLAATSQQIPTIRDGVRQAASDIVTLSPERKLGTYYVFFPGKDPDNLVYLNFALNLVSRSGETHRVVQISENVYRFNCYDYELSKKILDGLGTTDPWTHVRLKEAYTVQDLNVLPFSYRGNEYSSSYSVFAKHTLPEMVLLAGETQSLVPIFYGPWFIPKITTTLDGGIYYDLQGYTGLSEKEIGEKFFGVRRGNSFPIGNISKTGISLSEVTDSSRTVYAAQATNLRPAQGVGFYIATRDIAKVTRDPRKHAIRTIVDQRYDASEILGLGDNGMLKGLISNEAGVIQLSVPDTIAHNGNPGAADTRLQPVADCIICHASSGGFKPLTGSFLSLFKNGFNVFSDYENAKELQAEYGTDFTEALERGRLTFNNACIDATGTTAIEASEIFSKKYRSYLFAAVTPKVVCREIGYEVEDDVEGILLLRTLFLKERRLVDQVLGLLVSGSRVNRTDWEQSFPLFMELLYDETNTINNRAARIAPGEPINRGAGE